MYKVLIIKANDTYKFWNLSDKILFMFRTGLLSINRNISKLVKGKVKWSRYRLGVAQRVGRGIALLFHDRGTRRGWVVSSTLRPHFTPEKESVPFLQEAGWAPGPVWTGGKSRPHRDSIPDRPARSQSLYWLSYRVHLNTVYAQYLLLCIQCWDTPDDGQWNCPKHVEYFMK